MKISLIVPSVKISKNMYLEYPLGVGFIGTVLEKEGHEVTIYDQSAECINDIELASIIVKSKPDIIAFSLVTSTYSAGLKILSEMKKQNSNITYIAGGIHASLFPEHVLNSGFDYVVIGEGEKTIVELIQKISSGDSTECISGTAFLKNNRCVIEPINREVVLKDLPEVNRSLYNMKLYTHHTVITARGCHYNCKFCCDLMRNFGINHVRSIQLSRTIKEILLLEHAYNAKNIFFADDVFAGSPKGIEEFCMMYHENNLKVNWIAQARADILSKKLTQAMKAANCSRIYIGVESGSDSILNNSGKRTSTDIISSGIKNAKESGLKVKTGWIYGLPGSLKEQYKSIDLMLKARPHQISIHQLIPFPGTEYYNNPKKYGIKIKNPYDFASFSYGGLNSNFSFEYITRYELEKLIFDTCKALDSEGYVHSDNATESDKYVYTTPLSLKNINAFKYGKKNPSFHSC